MDQIFVAAAEASPQKRLMTADEVAGLVAYLLGNPWVLAVAGTLWLACLIVYCYLASVASRIYLCALYLYATDGVVTGSYDASMMAEGWKMKKSRA